MDTAIVTGAESALGIRLVERLVRQGCKVYGLGNNFSQIAYSHKDFIAKAVDITDLNATRECVAQIVAESGHVHMLIHALDVAPATDFEKLGVGNLEAVLTIGLTTPVVLTRLLLPNLLQVCGQLVFVLSTNKEGAAPNPTSGLLESGLRSFAAELLLRHRDAGLRVSSLLLRHNDTPGKVVAMDGRNQTRIDPDHAAEVLERILAEGDPNILGELTLYPRCSPLASAQVGTPLPIDPYRQIQLPPKHKQAVDPAPIPTQKPERPKPTFTISDAELEDRIAEAIEDYDRESRQSQPSRAQTGKPKDSSSHSSPKPNQPKREKASQSETKTDTPQPEGERKSKRSRGRSRRQRERARREREQQSATPPKEHAPEASDAKTPPRAKEPAPKIDVKPPIAKTSRATSDNSPTPEQALAKKIAKKKTARKAATKKIATKAAKKKTARKTATKKAVGEAATQKTAGE